MPENFTDNQGFGTSDLMVQLRAYGREIRRQKMLVLLIFTLCIGIQTYRWASHDPQFVAVTTFMLNDNEAPGLGFSSILGQIGIPASGQRLSVQKIMEIAKTRRIGDALYLQTVTHQGRSDLMGNFLIDALDKENLWFPKWFWQKRDSLYTYRFQNPERDSLSTQQNTILKTIHETIQKKLSTHVNEKSAIMEIKFMLADEHLAVLYSNMLYDQLSNFYINKTVEKQQDTYQRLQAKVDSLRKIIFRKDYALADVKDSYRNLYLNQDAVPGTQIDRDIKMLSIIYGEALKNMELASFNLQNKTPFIQYLDRPSAPLNVLKQQLWKNLLIALFAATSILVAYLILSRVIKEIF